MAGGYSFPEWLQHRFQSPSVSVILKPLIGFGGRDVTLMHGTVRSLFRTDLVQTDRRGKGKRGWPCPSTSAGVELDHGVAGNGVGHPEAIAQVLQHGRKLSSMAIILGRAAVMRSKFSQQPTKQ